MKKTMLLSWIIMALSAALVLASCSGPAVVLITAAPSAPAASITAPATSTAPESTTVTTAPLEPLHYGNAQKYAIAYTVSIENTGYSPTNIKLYLPLPKNQDAQKDVRITAVSPEPQSQGAEKASGNGMAYWEMKGTPKKGDTAQFELKFTLMAYETNTSIDAASVKPYDKDSEEVKLYTGAEKYIESGDPAITTLADKLTKGQTNPYLMAKGFYDYIIDNTTYALLGQGLNGAKFLLVNKKGECGDYSSLFIALCRAKGIPARPVVGYWAISGNDQTHVWAEYFLQGIGWVPVDATIGQQSKEKRSYYFGNMDNQRVILSKGFNTPLVPEGPGKFVAPILQVPLWWYKGSGDADTLTMERNWSVEKAK